MKNMSEFYNDILNQLAISSPELKEEFENQLSKTQDKKEIFLWLQKKTDSGDMPKEMEPIITDFFYSIH